MSGVDTLTEAGTLIGTAAYMSPEQASGEAATPASDVYSFGVILFRMLTGRLPFETPSPVDLLRRQLHEEPPAISALRPDAPMTLAAVAEESLAKSPAGSAAGRACARRPALGERCRRSSPGSGGHAGLPTASVGTTTLAACAH